MRDMICYLDIVRATIVMGPSRVNSPLIRALTHTSGSGKVSQASQRINQSRLRSLVNRWVSTRINLLSSVVVAVTAVIALVSPDIDASLAGYTLAFATTVTNDVSCL